MAETNSNMNIKQILLIITVIIAGLLVGFNVFKSCNTIPEFDYSKIAEQISIKIDSVKRTIVLPPVYIIDSIFKERTKIIYIPAEADTSAIKILLGRLDSVENELKKLKVDKIAILDTIYKPTDDTLKITHSCITDFWTIRLGFAPRQITVPEKTIFIPLPPPKAEWYETREFWGTAGLVIGVIGGIIIIK